MNKGKARFIILMGLFAAGTVSLVVVLWPFIRNLGDETYRASFGAWVRGLGIRGVLLMLGIQALQIMVAVIPGGPVQLAAGAAYGALGGLVLIAGGSALTSAVIFSLVRRFGLPLLTRFFGEKNLSRWMFLKDSKKVSRLVFLLFLIPGTPKDLLTWMAPISGISLTRFAVLSTLARIPAIFASVVMGDSVMKGRWALSGVLFAVTAVSGFTGIRLRDRIALPSGKKDIQNEEGSRKKE